MKTIKFNLILDDNPVRNIEQLRENFSVEDILQTYKNGLLEKWLKVRGYNEYLVKVEQLKENNDKDIIKSLIEIFEMYVDEDDLESIMNEIDYINTRGVKDSIAIDLDNHEFNAEQYHARYDKLVDSIAKDKDNIGKLKAIFEEIEEKYINLFKMNYWSICKGMDKDSVYVLLIMNSFKRIKEVLFKDEKVSFYINRTIKKGILVSQKEVQEDKNRYTETEIIDIKQKCSNRIMGGARRTNGLKKLITNEKVLILGVEKPRDYNLDVVMWDKELSNEKRYLNCIGQVFDGLYIETRAGQYGAVVSYIYCSDIKTTSSKSSNKDSETLPKYIKSYSKKTEGYWKEIEGRDKKIMIIDIESNSKVRSTADDRELQGKDIKDKFVILNGLEYSSDSNEPLIYMEV